MLFFASFSFPGFIFQTVFIKEQVVNRKLIAVLICCLIIQPAIANQLFTYSHANSVFLQQEARVEGSVSDPTGAKIVAARILLRDASGRVVAETQTDAQGRFSFAKVATGDYEIVVEAAGFLQSEKTPVTVKGGGTQTL